MLIKNTLYTSFLTISIFSIVCIFILFLQPVHASSPNFKSMLIDLDSKPNIGVNIEKDISYLFNMLAKKNRRIEVNKITAFLDMVVDGKIKSGDVSLNDKNAKGAFLRETLECNFDRLISYFFTPNFPVFTLMPSGLRTSMKLKGSEHIPPTVQNLFLQGKLATPSVFFAKEIEETTPDLFTNATYTYSANKLYVLLPEYRGKRISIIVQNQPDKSSGAHQAVIFGDDQNWNYIYSTLTGGTGKVPSWVTTHIYNSSMIFVMIEKDDTTSEVLLLKWLRAGWIRVNAVKSYQIYQGSKRVLYSMNKVLSNKKLPPPQNIVQKYKSLNAMSLANLQKELLPYGKKLSTVASKNKVLQSSSWEPFVADSKYPSTLSKGQATSLLIENYLKEILGVPIL